MSDQKKAFLFALSAILCWSTIGSAFKITLRYLDPLTLLFYSSSVACCILFLILIVQGKVTFLRKLNRKEILLSAFLGLLNPFFYYVVLLKAYNLLPAQEAGTLNYVWPLVLVLLSILMLKQKVSFWSICAIFVSFLGILIISTHGKLLTMHFSSLTGVVLALFSAIIWALYWIFNLKDPREAVSKLFLNFCFGLVYSGLLLMITHRFIVPSMIGLIGAIYIGIFEMGITFVLWLNALKFSSTAAKVSNLIYLSPFISLIIIHFTVGEIILPSTVIGLAFIVGGIVLQQSLKR